MVIERLGSPEKFVRVSEAVSGQPDPPSALGIPSKPAGARARAPVRAPVPMSACLPTRSHQHALAPFPKNFWLHALRETGSDQADGKAWQVSFATKECCLRLAVLQ
jgi:hypothetical protein